MIKEYKNILRNKKFIFLWMSQIFSQLTINMMNFLLLIKLFNSTQSTIATSLLWISYSLPAVFIGPFSAAFVDILNKRKTLMLTNLLQCLAIFAFAFFYSNQFQLIYVLIFFYSLLNQFYVPSESSSVPTLVRKKILPQANSLFFLTQQGSVLIGYSFAGVLNHLLGFKNTLYICSAFLFLAFISVNFLPDMKPATRLYGDIEKKIKNFFGTIVTGYNFIKGTRGVILPFVLLVGVQAILAMLIVTLPLVAKDIIRININSLGTLIVAPTAAGAILMALLVPKMLRNGTRKKTIIEGSLIASGAMFLLITFLWVIESYFLSVFIGILMCFVLGACFVGITIPSLTFLQEVTPKELRGRVFGNYWFISIVINLFPIIFSGAIAEIFGIKYLLLLISLFSVSAYIISRKYGQNILSNQYAKTN